jgi:hypothetical protein
MKRWRGVEIWILASCVGVLVVLAAGALLLHLAAGPELAA